MLESSRLLGEVAGATSDDSHLVVDMLLLTVPLLTVSLLLLLLLLLLFLVVSCCGPTAGAFFFSLGFSQESRQGHQRDGGPGTPHRRRGPPAEELGRDQDHEGPQSLPRRHAPRAGEHVEGCLMLSLLLFVVVVVVDSPVFVVVVVVVVLVSRVEDAPFVIHVL